MNTAITIASILLSSAFALPSAQAEICTLGSALSSKEAQRVLITESEYDYCNVSRVDEKRLMSGVIEYLVTLDCRFCDIVDSRKVSVELITGFDVERECFWRSTKILH